MASPSRVLLCCPEPLGHAHPAGVGIRFVEITRALIEDGHQVIVASPDGGVLPGARAVTTSPEDLHHASTLADAAVVQGHIANDFFAHARRIPTVVDLYDPYIIENLHYAKKLGHEVFRHDYETLIRSLRQGDFFLCASEPQRLFYLGLFLALGRLDPPLFREDPQLRSVLSIAPFGVPPPRRVPSKDRSSPALLFGGIYDWYDPILAIEAVAKARLQLPALTLTFNQHPNAATTPQSVTEKALAHVRDKGYTSFVSFEPWVSYEVREPFYDRFTAALLTFPQSIETDLAMRTRIFDYLWAGLPVITSPAPGTDPILERFGAGAVVRVNEPSAFATAIVEQISNSDRYEASVQGAARFAEGHQWSGLLEPLLEFCREPRIDRAVKWGGKIPASLRVPRRSIVERIRRRIERQGKI